jgi:hypothetical protein
MPFYGTADWILHYILRMCLIKETCMHASQQCWMASLTRTICQDWPLMSVTSTRKQLARLSLSFLSKKIQKCKNHWFILYLFPSTSELLLL